ncbi:unnamed protein product [Effrenium voratum]|nr:unnamed protein product [Effrenium voratum]
MFTLEVACTKLVPVDPGYLQTLQKASPSERLASGSGGLSAFPFAVPTPFEVFNRKMVSLMREQWKHLGTTETGKSVGVGCPQFMRGRQERSERAQREYKEGRSKGILSQKMTEHARYPNLVEGVLRGGAAAYGRPGCGQADGTTRNRIPFQLGCWEMQKNPYGMSEEGESDAIQEFAQIQKMKDEREAMRRYAGTEQAENYKLWFSAKNVIHHIVGAEVHKLARELLDPEPEKKKKKDALSRRAERHAGIQRGGPGLRTKTWVRKSSFQGVDTLKGKPPFLGARSARVPRAVASSLKATAQELHSSLAQLQESQLTAQDQLPLRQLRTLLLAVQHAREAFSSDPSISMQAATKKDADAQEALAVPQLGLGKESSLKSLTDILPLGQIHDALRLHVQQLPPACASPLSPFAQQILQLSRALLLGGLQAMLAASQVTLELLRLVCFMMEKGLNSKEEEKEGDGEGDGKTEWAAGTGMGEGEGLRDVTEEIEDDAQLEGTKNEKQEEQPEPEQQKPEEETPPGRSAST